MTGSTLRIGPPSDEEMSDAQRAAVQRIAAGPRGGLFGPFVPLLHSPELMTRLQLVGEYLRFDGTLDRDLFEVVILTVARRWDQAFEWGYHHPLALAAGVPEGATEQIAANERPTVGRPEIALVWEVVVRMLDTGRLPDALFAELAPLGTEAIVEIVATAGYYTTLALTMNVAGTPAPEGAPELPTAPAATEGAR